MGTILVTLGTLIFAYGTYQLGFVKGYEAVKADEKEFHSFWKEVEKKGLK